MTKEIEIPEGYEARIECNRVILKRKESEDEKIRKTLLRCCDDWDKGQFVCMKKEDVASIRAYLEKNEEPKWSPSEGEMGVLYKLCYISNQITDEDDTELTRLYQDLKREYFNGHSFENMFSNEKQKEQKPHLELKAGKWYICHRAYCARADHLTVKEGERFQCEEDGIVKGFVIKEPEKYFKECSAPAPMEKEQKPTEWSLDDRIQYDSVNYSAAKDD